MNWFRKKHPLLGQVLFRSNLPPRAEEFDYLSELGVEVRPARAAADDRWALDLRHREWGEATLSCPRETLSLPRAAIEYDARLTKEEKQELPHARSQVWLRHDPPAGHLLRDRKHLLRYLNAICGTDGVAALDAVSSTVWSVAAMQDELSHDADLDVQNIFTLHAIHDGGGGESEEEPRAFWAHSHGLREVGLFDFNLIQPSPDATGNRTDFCRALAFAILEQDLKLDGDGKNIILTQAPIRFVSAGRFLEGCRDPLAEKYRQNVDDFHMEGHGVACEQEANGYFARLLRRGGIRPAHFLTREFPDDSLVGFSTTAGQLMGERARNTLSVFSRWREEFADFQPTCIVKLGYEVDGDRTHLEFPWFEVHAVHDDTLDATLINKPFHIARMKLGDRDTHPVQRLADWKILMPFGQLDPRSMSLARTLRIHREELLPIMRQIEAAKERGG